MSLPRRPAPRDDDPRLCRTAVVAACLAAAVAILVAALGVGRGLRGLLHGPVPAVVLATVAAVALALAVPTALGIVAIRRIRRAEGALTGLGLAVAAALLYPLLLLDGLIFLAWLVGSRVIVYLIYTRDMGDPLPRLMRGLHYGFRPTRYDVLAGWPTLLMLTVIVGMTVNVMIAWRVWRAANRPPGEPPASEVD